MLKPRIKELTIQNIVVEQAKNKLLQEIQEIDSKEVS